MMATEVYIPNSTKVFLSYLSNDTLKRLIDALCCDRIVALSLGKTGDARLILGYVDAVSRELWINRS